MMSLVLNMKLRKLQIHLTLFPVQILLRFVFSLFILSSYSFWPNILFFCQISYKCSFILHLLELLMLLITLANPLPPCLSPKLHRSPANSTPSNVIFMFNSLILTLIFFFISGVLISFTGFLIHSFYFLIFLG